MRRGFVLFFTKIWNLGSSWYLCPAKQLADHRPRWLQEFFDPLLVRPWPGEFQADFFMLP